jgi:hypothetical protein
MDFSGAKSLRQVVHDSLLGRKLWKVVAGSGTGSVLSLGFGRAIAREHRIENRNLLEMERSHESEFCLFVNCTWRILSRGVLLSTWCDSNERGGPMLAGLSTLRDARVEKISVRSGVADLSIRFENRTLLHVTPDIRNPAETEFNYWVSGPLGRVACGNDGRLMRSV